jgi:hypothetical protein
VLNEELLVICYSLIVNDELISLNLALMPVADGRSQTSLPWRKGLREGEQNGLYLLLEFSLELLFLLG